jgi:hypothetical protein
MVPTLQVVEAGDLAGGVALEGQRQLVLGDAAAVVGHPDAPHAALFELHVDGRRAGVHGVFEHFLEHRGGPFDHLAGGDLVDEVVGRRWMGMAASCSAGADCSRCKQKRPARHAAAGHVAGETEIRGRSERRRAARRAGRVTPSFIPGAMIGALSLPNHLLSGAPHEIRHPLFPVRPARDASRLRRAGQGVLIALQRLGVETIAVDRYPNAPGHQVAHRAHVIPMTDGAALRRWSSRRSPT